MAYEICGIIGWYQLYGLHSQLRAYSELSIEGGFTIL